MNDITNQTIEKAANGDIDAFELIYRKCCSFVHNVAFRIVTTQDDAEEVTQEVFISVYRNLKNFRFNASFKTWIYRITINTAVNLSKKWDRNRRREVSFDESEMAVAGRSGTDASVEKQDQDAYIASLLNQLNEDQKVCLILRSIEGLSYAEIADVLNININTVRTRIKRGREKLLNFKKEVMNNEV